MREYLLWGTGYGESVEDVHGFSEGLRGFHVSVCSGFFQCEVVVIQCQFVMIQCEYVSCVSVEDSCFSLSW